MIFEGLFHQLTLRKIADAPAIVRKLYWAKAFGAKYLINPGKIPPAVFF